MIATGLVGVASLAALLDLPLWAGLFLVAPIIVVRARAGTRAARNRGIASRDVGPQWFVGMMAAAFGGVAGVAVGRVAWAVHARRPQPPRASDARAR